MDNFTMDIQRFVAKAKGNLDLVVRKVALDLFRRVILKTPVATGRLRGSWTVGIGSIPPKSIELNDKTGTATISRVTAATLDLKAGETIFLISTLAYARAIEYGHSKQAPAGMVRLSVAAYGAVVNKAAGEVPK